MNYERNKANDLDESLHKPQYIQTMKEVYEVMDSKIKSEKIDYVLAGKILSYIRILTLQKGYEKINKSIIKDLVDFLKPKVKESGGKYLKALDAALLEQVEKSAKGQFEFEFELSEVNKKGRVGEYANDLWRGFLNNLNAKIEQKEITHFQALNIRDEASSEIRNLAREQDEPILIMGEEVDRYKNAQNKVKDIVQKAVENLKKGNNKK